MVDVEVGDEVVDLALIGDDLEGGAVRINDGDGLAFSRSLAEMSLSSALLQPANARRAKSRG